MRCPATYALDKDNTMYCNPAEPQKDRQIFGMMKRPILDSSERQSWLQDSPMGIARSDTAALPISVSTSWDFDLGPLKP